MSLRETITTADKYCLRDGMHKKYGGPIPPMAQIVLEVIDLGYYQRITLSLRITRVRPTRNPDHGPVAQVVERETEDLCVGCSNQPGSTQKNRGECRSAAPCISRQVTETRF